MEVNQNAIKLRRLLAEHNLTQASLAAKLGIPRRTIENWCTGARKPPAYIIILIEHAINTGYNYEKLDAEGAKNDKT